MSQDQQLLQLICTLATMGLASIMLLLFYPFLQPQVRIPAIPLVVCTSWWIGQRLSKKQH